MTPRVGTHSFDQGAPLIVHVTNSLGAYVLKAVPIEKKVDFAEGVMCYLYCRPASTSDDQWVDVGAVVMYQPELTKQRITTAIKQLSKKEQVMHKPMSPGRRRQLYQDAVARNELKARGAG
jgi:hypothetical protein